MNYQEIKDINIKVHCKSLASKHNLLVKKEAKQVEKFSESEDRPGEITENVADRYEKYNQVLKMYQRSSNICIIELTQIKYREMVKQSLEYTIA